VVEESLPSPPLFILIVVALLLSGF
jgi:hypothetical protein